MLQLCFDLIQEWILKNPRASICTSEGVNDFKDMAIFQDYHGLPEFREVWTIDFSALNISAAIFLLVFLPFFNEICRQLLNLWQK